MIAAHFTDVQVVSMTSSSFSNQALADIWKDMKVNEYNFHWL